MSDSKSTSLGEMTGTQYGNRISSETTSGMEKFHARQGHGFAAERADHLHDYINGHDAQMLGDDNAVNGADRIVDGQMIQSKYCASGSACVAECFHGGHFRYYTESGKPMQIEVPSDMYDSAVEAMERRIRNGEVDGVTDPSKAKEIIRRGAYTYEEAKAIAQSGTIESLKFDAVNGMIIATSAVGVSAVITFAISMWNGDDFSTAVERAVISGLKVGGVSFLSTILASQATRMGITAGLGAGTDFLAKTMGSKVSSYIANGLQTGENIYGATAVNNVSKLLRNNILTAAITVAILSARDTIDMFNGRISGGQLFKNVTTTAGAVAGGAAGWVGGAAAGAAAGSFVPIIGTAAGAFIGGIIGSFAGGSVGGTVTKKTLDAVIEDDAQKMLRIFESELGRVLEHEFLTQYEAELLMESIKEDMDYDALKDMYASGSYTRWANAFIKEKFDDITMQREFIEMPSDEEWSEGLRRVLEYTIDGKDISSNMEMQRQSFLAKKRAVLKKYNLLPRQMGKIMRPVQAMNRTLVKTERTLQRMKKDEREYHVARTNVLKERMVLKNDIQEILSEERSHLR